MNPVFPARRRAEQFSSMVEDPSTRLSDTGSTYADLAPLAGLVAELRSTPTPEARPEFVSGLRGRLMLAAETALVPGAPRPVEARTQTARPAPRRTARDRRLAVAVGGFALVSASASMSVAAQTALPGDTLYPLKRALENVHEGAQRDADDKGVAMLGNASSRLDEVDRLTRTGEQDADVIAQTLQDFSDQASEASAVLLDDYAETGRLSSIEELQTFTETSLDALHRLEGLVPDEARASLIAATRVLDQISQEAFSACPSCGVLPLLDSAVRSVGISPLFEDVLEAAPPAPAPTPPAERPSRPTRQQPPSRAADADPVQVASPEQAPEGEGTTPPRLAPDPRPADDGEQPLDGIGGLVTGLDDPLGDLLAGTGEAVSEQLPTNAPATPQQ